LNKVHSPFIVTSTGFSDFSSDLDSVDEQEVEITNIERARNEKNRFMV
jgi:hypothetical protein